MKYYFCSFDGIGYGVAYRLLQEGHSVTVAQIQDNKELGNGDKPEDPEMKRRRLSCYSGILKKLPMPQMLIQMRAEKNKDDCFVIFDFNNLWKYAEMVQKMGFKNGFFPTKADYEMESDREAAKEIVKKHYPGLTIGDVKEFKKAQDGIQFLQEAQDETMWVLKGNDDCAQTVCPDTKIPTLAKEELTTQLEKDGPNYEKGGYILEEKIMEPFEMTPEAQWYNGKLIAITVDIENKPMGAGNIGKQCGCAQNIVFEIDPESKIAEAAFPPYIHEQAAKRKGLFVFDAGLLLKDGKLYFTEFCSQRWGWDSFYTQLSMCESVGSYFEALVAGQNPYKYKFGAATRGFNIDIGSDKMTVKDRKMSWLDETDKDTWLYDMKMKDGCAINAGCAFDLVVFTGGSNTFEGAVNKAYKAAEGFSFSNMIYRPKFDFNSTEYQTSIPNRYEEGRVEGLY